MISRENSRSRYEDSCRGKDGKEGLVATLDPFFLRPNYLPAVGFCYLFLKSPNYYKDEEKVFCTYYHFINSVKGRNPLTVVLEKTLESPSDCKEIQPVHPKGDQSWVFIGRTDAEAETPILWPPDAKS